MQETRNPPVTSGDENRRELARAAKARSPKEAAELLAEYPAATIASVLQLLNPALAQDVSSMLGPGVLRPAGAREKSGIDLPIC